MRGRWFLRGVGFAILFILSIFVFGYVTMWLWNTLIPVIFHGPVITYWQALGLMVLARILTGGFRKGWRGGHGCGCRGGYCGGGYRGRWHQHWKQRMDEKIANMSPEDREKFMAKMKEKCGWYYQQDDKPQEEV